MILAALGVTWLALIFLAVVTEIDWHKDRRFERNWGESVPPSSVKVVDDDGVPDTVRSAK